MHITKQLKHSKRKRSNCSEENNSKRHALFFMVIAVVVRFCGWFWKAGFWNENWSIYMQNMSQIKAAPSLFGRQTTKQHWFYDSRTVVCRWFCVQNYEPEPVRTQQRYKKMILFWLLSRKYELKNGWKRNKIEDIIDQLGIFI